MDAAAFATGSSLASTDAAPPIPLDKIAPPFARPPLASSAACPFGLFFGFMRLLASFLLSWKSLPCGTRTEKSAWCRARDSPAGTAPASRRETRPSAGGRIAAPAHAAVHTSPRRSAESAKRDRRYTASCCGERDSDQDFGAQTAAAGRGNEADAQELGLHAGDGACFACRGGAGIDLLVFGVDVGHGALQNNVYCGGRGAEDGLPAHRGAGIGRTGKAGERKLRAGSGASGEGFVVEAEADVTGE